MFSYLLNNPVASPLACPFGSFKNRSFGVLSGNGVLCLTTITSRRLYPIPPALDATYHWYVK